MDVVTRDTVDVVERLHAVAELYADRNTIYQNTHVRFGRIMEAMMPEGLKIADADDWSRVFLLVMRVAKEDRHCRVLAMGGGAHTDSMNDLAAYSQMTNELEDLILQRERQSQSVIPPKSSKIPDGHFAANAPPLGARSPEELERLVPRMATTVEEEFLDPRGRSGGTGEL